MNPDPIRDVPGEKIPEHILDASVTPAGQPTPLRQIRTFQGDVAEALHRQQETLVSIQHAEVKRTLEQEKAKESVLEQHMPALKRERSPEEEAERHSRRTGMLLALGILLLVLLGTFGSWYAYKGYKEKIAVPVTPVAPNKFLATDAEVEFDAKSLDRNTLIEAVQTERIKESGSGIEQIELYVGSSTGPVLLKSDTFLALLNTHAPKALVRALNPLFMLGVLGKTPRHTFLLIKLDSFENAFPGMLAWERDLADDLLPLFASQAIVEMMPSATEFIDVTIRNKDARILKDPNGHTVLLYAFFDNNTLVVTDDEETLRTLITRLDSEKLTR